jgi:NAD(P)-dependent dehydrogenase (short-subunit alcohol dehydrogenase family)
VSTASWAIITGSSGGIGKEMVRRFVSEGYRVLGLDQNPYDGEVATAFLKSDLDRFCQDEEYRRQFLSDVLEVIGQDQLHVLINNAATQVLAAVEDISSSAWTNTINVNLGAPFFLTQGLLARLAAAQGSVINIASIHAKLTKPGFTAYATSKAALIGLTRAMAVEIGSRVRVNAIAPAAIATPMLEAGFIDRPHKLAELRSFHPVHAIGLPSQVADLALHLTTHHSKFINGSVLEVDGGIGARLHDPL